MSSGILLPEQPSPKLMTNTCKINTHYPRKHHQHSTNLYRKHVAWPLHTLPWWSTAQEWSHPVARAAGSDPWTWREDSPAVGTSARCNLNRKTARICYKSAWFYHPSWFVCLLSCLFIDIQLPDYYFSQLSQFTCEPSSHIRYKVKSLTWLSDVNAVNHLLMFMFSVLIIMHFSLFRTSTMMSWYDHKQL